MTDPLAGQRWRVDHGDAAEVLRGLPDGCVSPRPRRPALRYFGGKWQLAAWIVRHLPAHRCYVEVFGGGASVLLSKPTSDVEVYNDAAGAVVAFFRVVRERPEDLVRVLRLTPFGVAEFQACRETAGDELEAARRFFVRSWQGIRGATGGDRSTGWRRTADRSVAAEFAGAVENLSAVAARLRSVAIDCLDWREVLRRYDRPDTLFYVDPPYLPSARVTGIPSDGYGTHDMTADKHVELLDRLAAVRGLVVLSGYPSSLYDDRLAGWTRHARTLGRQSVGSSTEVLWTSPARATAARPLGYRSAPTAATQLDLLAGGRND